MVYLLFNSKNSSRNMHDSPNSSLFLHDSTKFQASTLPIWAEFIIPEIFLAFFYSFFRKNWAKNYSISQHWCEGKKYFRNPRVSLNSLRTSRRKIFGHSFFCLKNCLIFQEPKNLCPIFSRTKFRTILFVKQIFHMNLKKYLISKYKAVCKRIEGIFLR